jgi:hypothetical protein
VPGQQLGTNSDVMNKPHPEDPDIMIEYDLAKMKSVPNPYAKYFPQGRDVVAVVLDPDIAERFPDSKSVNDALRGLTQLVDAMPAKKPKRRSRAKATA